MNLGLGVVYDSARNLTCGMLLGCSRSQAAFLLTQLEKVAMLACYPLLLPTMLLGYQRSFISEGMKCTRDEMLQVEHTSGQTIWWTVGLTAQPKGKAEHRSIADTKELSKHAFGVVQSCTLHDRLAEDLVVLANSVAKSQPVLEQIMRDDEPGGFAMHAVHERLEFVLNKAELISTAARTYKERAHVQISAVSVTPNAILLYIWALILSI
jgi:hypothetical protein